MRSGAACRRGLFGTSPRTRKPPRFEICWTDATEAELRWGDLSMEKEEPNPQQDENLIIVGVGASAGGLEAFSELLRHLPPTTGMAFVLVQHLDPRHESALSELLAAKTQMQVLQVQNETRI